MLKEIRSLNIQGTRFVNPTELSLFYSGGKAAKAVLLYGRNGAGKSTIAHAFRKIKGLEVDNIQSASVHGDQAAPITLTEEEKSHIYVFDEEFVNENVRVQGDSLGAIVMIGERAELIAQIETLTAQLTSAEMDRDQKKSILDEYEDASNPKSPLYFISKICEKLKERDGWLEKTNRVITPKSTRVNKDTYKRFVALSPNKTRDELIIEYNSEWNNLIRANSGVMRITTLVPPIPDTFRKYETETVNSLLKQVVEHPDFSEREQYLFSLVQAGLDNELRIIAKEFSQPSFTRCPKCFQELSPSYKENIIENIQKVLSRNVDDHQESLRKLILPCLEFDLSPFESLSSYQAYRDKIEALNQIIEKNNSLIRSKVSDPFSPIYEEVTDLAPTLSELENCRKQLESERGAYNRVVMDTDSIIEKLLIIINKIAHWDVIDLATQHEKQAAEKEIAEKAYNDAVNVCAEIQRQIDKLIEEMKKIHIAIDLINKGLKYIFFSENRMLITVEDGSYRLYSNGRLVKPKDVSVGERNIIGLCYFFARILEGKKHETAYGEEYLLIIDDPVSSFDLENRIGILSYLKYQLGLFLMGNADTRALVLTHDLSTAYDIEKIYKEMKKACNTHFSGHVPNGYFSRELRNNQLIDINLSDLNEYTLLNNLMYEYAKGVSSEYEQYIGNIMRQVLEAFSTFEYKRGIDAVSTDDDILKVIETDLQDYFKNLMYRLVLNGGSHRADQVKNMQVDFFSVISESEKRRTAKEVLCFMRLLNAPHVKAHLGADAMADIDSWCEEIRNRIRCAP